MSIFIKGFDGSYKKGASYTRLAYIESSGTQCIDTGFKPTQNTSIVLKVGTGTGHFFTGTADTSSRFGIYALTTGGIDMAFGGSGYIGSALTGVTYPATIEFKNGSLKANGVEYTFNTQSAFNSTNNLYLFSEGDDSIGAGRLYSYQIYDNGTLARDFVPVMSPEGEVGLFDLVERKFYGNAGTGVFTGIEYAVLPEGYTQLTYIESTGTQYIDTGVKNQSDLVVQSKFMITDLSNGNVMGYGVNDASNRFEIFIYNNQWYLDFGNDDTRIYGGTFSVNTIYNIEMGNLYIKDLDTDTNIISGASVSDFEKTTNFYICCEADSAIGKWYSISMFDNGLLVRKYVPCKDPNSNIGLYDLINNQFYGNAGTGVFTGGEEV